MHGVRSGTELVIDQEFDDQRGQSAAPITLTNDEVFTKFCIQFTNTFEEPRVTVADSGQCTSTTWYALRPGGQTPPGPPPLGADGFSVDDVLGALSLSWSDP